MDEPDDQNQGVEENAQNQGDSGDKEMNEEEEQEEQQNDLMYIYEWVDKIQLSRSKRNIARDFSDAVLLAEIIKNYIPRLVDLHNYPSVSSKEQKKQNWNTLNNKVLKKLGIKISAQEIEDIITYKQFAIENYLKKVYNAIQNRTGVDISSGEVGKRKSDYGLSMLKKTLNEKEANIQQLNEIIEVLEMKLKSSREMEQTLQKKVNELTDILRNKGINV